MAMQHLLIKKLYDIVLYRTFSKAIVTLSVIDKSKLTVLFLMVRNPLTMSIKQCILFRQQCNCLDTQLCDVTFAHKFLHGKQMTVCE